MLAQVLIHKRDKQEESSTPGQARQQSERTSKPELSMAHLVKAEQDKQEKERFVVGCGKEERCGEDGEQEEGALCYILPKVIFHETMQDDEQEEPGHI